MSLNPSDLLSSLLSGKKVCEALGNGIEPGIGDAGQKSASAPCSNPGPRCLPVHTKILILRIPLDTKCTLFETIGYCETAFPNCKLKVVAFASVLSYLHGYLRRH